MLAFEQITPTQFTPRMPNAKDSMTKVQFDGQNYISCENHYF